jgi:transposase
MECGMARIASGIEMLECAKQAIASAQTIEQLRQAQAVVLPLEYGLSIEETAKAIGVSKGWACNLRVKFIEGQAIKPDAKPARGGRKRENLAAAEEIEFLATFFERASNGGILVVSEIRDALEKKLGRSVALASVYNLLHRHNWRKLAPDKHHPQSDPEAQVEWKKKLRDRIEEISKSWGKKKSIKLMFQDEARFGRISDVRRCWAPKPIRPLCQAMLTHEYTYAYGAVDVYTGKLDSLILPQVNTVCMQIFLDEVSARHVTENIVMVMDGAGWHRSDTLKVPDNMRIMYLPPYAPELNPIEHVWDDLREKFFHNRVFDSLDALENQLEIGLKTLEDNPEKVCSIVAWDWIINSLLI